MTARLGKKEEEKVNVVVFFFSSLFSMQPRLSVSWLNRVLAQLQRSFLFFPTCHATPCWDLLTGPPRVAVQRSVIKSAVQCKNTTYVCVTAPHDKSTRRNFQQTYWWL